jgi:hypothetical protein
MARRFALAATLAVVLAAVVQGTAGLASHSGPVASRIVDRTVVCQMPRIGYPDGTRFMTVSALYGMPPLMFASNGPRFELRVAVSTGPTGRDATGSVALNRRDCADTSLRVPLSARGLRGGPSTRLHRSFTCSVPTKVLMRVRADFKRPTAFSRDRETPWIIRARGQITTSSLAIASLRDRKPFAFASVDGASGKARIFVAPSRCTRTR